MRCRLHQSTSKQSRWCHMSFESVLSRCRSSDETKLAKSASLLHDKIHTAHVGNFVSSTISSLTSVAFGCTNCVEAPKAAKNSTPIVAKCIVESRDVGRLLYPVALKMCLTKCTGRGCKTNENTVGYLWLVYRRVHRSKICGPVQQFYERSTRSMATQCANR